MCIRDRVHTGTEFGKIDVGKILREAAGEVPVQPGLYRVGNSLAPGVEGADGKFQQIRAARQQFQLGPCADVHQLEKIRHAVQLLPQHLPAHLLQRIVVQIQVQRLLVAEIVKQKPLRDACLSRDIVGGGCLLYTSRCV